jgi:hypothetical protein
MSSLSVRDVIPVLTPEQKGLFFELIKNNTPDWLLAAPGELRHKLYQSLIASHRSQSEAGKSLSSLKSPQSFCAPLLAKAMADKLGEPLDINGVIFQHVRSTSSLLGLRRKLVLPIDRDLLSAACENFEASETQATNYNATSLIYIPEKITGREPWILPLQPHEFATLCRTLDLGKQYQTHLRAVFDVDAEVNPLRNKCIANWRNRFEVERHLALMKKYISADVHQMLQAVTTNQSPIKLGHNTLGYQGLQMFGVTLGGALFIGPVSEHADDDYRCVVYLPGDPLHPLKEYASFSDFERELSERLKKTAFRKFFTRYIKVRERLLWETELDARLYPRSNSMLPHASGYITLSGIDFVGDPFSMTYRQHAEQTLADARLMVVPTDDEDEKTRLARLDTYKTIGVDLLLMAASFIPVLGEVLLAATAVQLLWTVYEGISSWTRGEKEQATDHFFDVVENLILLAAFAAGTRAAGATFRVVRSSAFIKRLRMISLPAGQARLWKPDLSAYRQQRLLPQGLPPDERGLRWVEGQAFLTLDAHHYAVRPKPQTELWEVLAPSEVANRYSPVLETNGSGAWRHDTELVQEWDRLTLFRRFGFTRERIPDDAALRALAVSGIEDSVLRQIHIDNGHPPALLIDTVRRFRADATVTEFFDHLQTPASAPMADPDLQLQVLTTLAGWPADSAIQVVDSAGIRGNVYGAPTATTSLRITQQALDKGQLYSWLLSTLETRQRETLLGLTTTDAGEQSRKLLQIISEQAEDLRVQLFQRVYRRSEAASNGRAQLLLDRFADLPASVAEELVGDALIGEAQELDAGRIPLRLAQEVRRYLQAIAACRAYEGLYLDSGGGYDTNRLVLDTLEHLPGWSGTPLIEILEWSGSYGNVASIGPVDARERMLVNVLADRVSVFDGTEHPLTEFAGRTRAHYFQALWHGLSAPRKTALGLLADAGAEVLRENITRLALQRRMTFAVAMGDRPGDFSPMGLADRSPAGPGARSSANISIAARRAQELYPAYAPEQIQALLATLGSDEIAILMKLEKLRLEFLGIRETLSRWVSGQTWSAGTDRVWQLVPQSAKLRAMRTIIRSWRKEPGRPGDGLPDSLCLAPEPLGELPLIVGDFSHVTHLVMDGVAPTLGFNAFLQNFSHLRSLSLRENHLTQLPPALNNMAWLTELDLSNNQLHLSSVSASALEQLTRLRVLDLDLNPHLSHAPDVSLLADLESLKLRGCALEQWPRGIAGLARLRLLDLRDNQITALPAAAFDGPAALSRATRLHGNPLSAETLQQIATYQQANGVSFGVTIPTYQRLSQLSMAFDGQSARWLVGSPAAEAAPRRTTWEAVRAASGSRDFFNVLAHLVHTADYTQIYPYFSQRVWNVVEAAAEDARLRTELFRTARAGAISVDGYSAVFSEMEVQVLCFRARLAAGLGGAPLEWQLTHLLRGLFRLQELEERVLADINSRHQPGVHEQALEYSLAYRVGLAERLNLPGQPHALSRPLQVEVSTADLDEVYQAVMRVERTRAFSDWCSGQRFWIEFLESTQAPSFAAVRERSAQALAQLEGQAGLSREAAAVQMNAIHDNFRNERQALLHRLTEEALARNPVNEVAGSRDVDEEASV